MSVRLKLFLLPILCMGLFVSCDSSEKIGNSIDKERVDYRILSEEELTVEEYADKIFAYEEANNVEDRFIHRQTFLAEMNKRKAELEKELGVNGILLGFKYLNFAYNSVDQHGSKIELSSFLSWGTYSSVLGKKHNLNPRNIFLSAHPTIASNPEAPTSSKGGLDLLVSGDNLLILPDYIGYGITSANLHPYLNHEVAGKNMYDALVAGYHLATERFELKMKKEWKLYLLGASQGGAVALATHKYLETNKDSNGKMLADKWNFAYSYCCSGPYSPPLTFAKYREWGSVGIPSFIPMVIKSMVDSYPELLGKWTEDAFYSEKYLEKKAEFDALYSKKESNILTINKYFTKYFGTDSHGKVELSKFMSPEILDANSDLSKAFYRCLEKNDLTTGWYPVHKIYLFHGTGDGIVPLENSEEVVRLFTDKTSLEKVIWIGHVPTILEWYSRLLVHAW
ncbi:MAG: hypothetical protein ACRCY5_06655 [Phocaeicola sp.]